MHEAGRAGPQHPVTGLLMPASAMQAHTWQSKAQQCILNAQVGCDCYRIAASLGVWERQTAHAHSLGMIVIVIAVKQASRADVSQMS